MPFVCVCVWGGGVCVRACVRACMRVMYVGKNVDMCMYVLRVGRLKCET